MKPRKLQDTSLECFDEILNDGELEAMQMKALGLVQSNQGMTARELLRIGVEEGIYPREDRNAIAPRLTSLAEEGIIIRPSKRKCTITNKTTYTHEMAPEIWRQQRQNLRSQYRTEKKFVKHRMEITSQTKGNEIIHTTIMWLDGSVSCTCSELYHRSSDLRCHHAKGMILAETGKLLEGKK